MHGMSQLEYGRHRKSAFQQNDEHAAIYSAQPLTSMTDHGVISRYTTYTGDVGNDQVAPDPKSTQILLS